MEDSRLIKLLKHFGIKYNDLTEEDVESCRKLGVKKLKSILGSNRNGSISGIREKIKFILSKSCCQITGDDMIFAVNNFSKGELLHIFGILHDNCSSSKRKD